MQTLKLLTIYIVFSMKKESTIAIIKCQSVLERFKLKEKMYDCPDCAIGIY